MNENVPILKQIPMRAARWQNIAQFLDDLSVSLRASDDGFGGGGRFGPSESVLSLISVMVS